MADVPQPNSPILFHNYGTNNEGADSPISSVGSPTLSGDWVTFDGDDGYIYDTLPEESNIEGRIKFRIEEDFYNIDSTRCIWKSGGNSGIGFGIRVDNSNNILNIGIHGNRTNHLELSLYALEKDVWYTAYWSKTRVTILKESDDLISYTVNGDIDVSNGGLAASVGYAYSASPIDGGRDGQHFIGSIKSIYIWTDGDMAWPDVSDEASSKPFHQIIFGSDNDGLADDYYTQEGLPTENTDNVEFNGTNTGLYKESSNISYGSSDTKIAAKITFSADSFSGSQILWKIGGNSNGIAYGIDDSNNIGMFYRDGGFLDSIIVSSSLLSISTKYHLYANEEKVAIYNDDMSSLIVSASGTITKDSGSGDESIGFSYNQNPLTGGTDGSYFDGKIYEVSIYDADDFEFPETLGETSTDATPSAELQTLLVTQYDSTIYSEINTNVLVNLLNKSLNQYDSTVSYTSSPSVNILNLSKDLKTLTLSIGSVQDLNVLTLSFTQPSASVITEINNSVNLNILEKQFLINTVTTSIANKLIFPIIGDGVDSDLQLNDITTSITNGLIKNHNPNKFTKGISIVYNPNKFTKGINIVKR